MNTKKVYLDNIVTTPLRREVFEAMLPFLQEEYGNPQSLHSYGEVPRRAMEEAREKTAGLIGAEPDEIIFTSSGAEANNLALKGAAGATGSKGNHIIAGSIEHFSVLHPLRSLEKQGFEITYLPVDRNGLVDAAGLEKALRKNTILVSIMTANNEIGTIEPVKDLVKIVREKSDACFHTDAVAAVGHIPINVTDSGVDLLSLSAHQFYGPKGAAALFFRKGTRLLPLIEGGIQENGRRAGIDNVPGIVGLGKASELAVLELSERGQRLQDLRNRLREIINREVEHVVFTGHPERRLPGHLSICVEFIEGEAMLMLLSESGVAAASGSTCTSKALKASHVLVNLGIPPEIIQGSLVLSLGDDNSEEDVEYFGKAFPPIVKRLRDMSPLYRKFRQTGMNKIKI